MKFLEFSLNREHLRELFSDSCFYCGTPPSLTHRRSGSPSVFNFNGIDRLDNSRGYVEGNVVSCCKVCNFRKGAADKLEFILWIEKVYLNLIGNH